MTQAQDPAAGGNPASDMPSEADPEHGLHPLLAAKLRETRLRDEAALRERREAAAKDVETSEDKENIGDPAEPVREPPVDRERAIREAEAAVIQRADEKGGLFPLEIVPRPYGPPRQPRLPDPAREPALFRPAPPIPVAEDAEAELTGIIAECRFLMREMAFHSARLTPNPEVRVQFIDSACRLAEAGARVAEGVARLRGGPGPVEESRKTLTYEVVHRTAPMLDRGEGGTP